MAQEMKNNLSTNDQDAYQWIVQELSDKKADNIVTLDLRNHQSLVDYMVIASGQSSRHIASLASYLYQKNKHLFSNVHIEESAEWVLLDLGPVIIHLFKPETRETYALEKMWSVH